MLKINTMKDLCHPRRSYKRFIEELVQAREFTGFNTTTDSIKHGATLKGAERNILLYQTKPGSAAGS